MSFFSTFVAYLKHVIRGGAGGGGGEVPTMTTTTITIGNRCSRPLYIQYGSPPTKPEIVQAWSDFRSWAMNAGYGSSASISIRNRRASIVHSVDTSTIIMNSPSINPAAKRLLDAFHLVESDATIWKVVMSISTDRHVWNSIVRNKAVQELCRSKPCTANEETALSYMEEGESASQIIKWLFSIMASRITEFMDKIDGYVSGVLQRLPRSNNTMLPLDGVMEERVRSPMLLSIVLIMVVFVTKSVDMENS